MLLDSAAHNTIFSIANQINFNSEVTENQTEKIALNFAIAEEVQQVQAPVDVDISAFVQEPIPVDDLKSVLSSEFALPSLTFSGTMQSFDPYALIMTAIANWIPTGKFVYITYDSVEVRFQNVSNFNTYGAMMLGWYPDPSPLVPEMTNTNAQVAITALSQCHPIILSVATTDSGVMEIPWIHPANKQYFANTAGTSRNSQFRLWYITLFGPTATTSTGSVGTYVRCWAKLKNPRFIFRAPYTNAVPVLPNTGPQLRESDQNDDTDEFEVIAQSGTGFSSPFRSKPTFNSPTISMSTGGESATIVEMMAHQSEKKKQIVTRSSQRKNKKRNHVTPEPIVEGLDNEIPPVNVRQNAFATFAAFAGAKAASLLTESPDEGKASPIFRSMLPARAGDHNIGDMCRIPSCIRVLSFTTAGAQLVLNCDPCSTGQVSTLNAATYMTYFSTMFRMWRGSMKYMFRFYTSPEIMARFQLTLNKGGAGIPPTVDTAINEIFTVKGDTVYTVTVPYIHPSDWVKTSSVGLTNWKPGDTSYTVGTDYSLMLQANFIDGMTITGDEVTQLILTLLDPPTQPADVAPNVYCAVFLAAGDDFEFCSLCDRKAPTVIAQSIEAEFESPFHVIGGLEEQPLIKGMSGDNFSCEQVMKRYSPRQFANLKANPTRLTPTRTHTLYVPALCGPYDYVGCLFKFWTGPVTYGFDTTGQTGTSTFALASDSGQPTSIPTPDLGLLSGNGVFKAPDYATNPFCEVTLPYVSSYSMAQTHTYTDASPWSIWSYLPQPFPLQVQFPETSPSTYWIKAGPSFALAVRLPVPAMSTSQW